MSDMVIFSVNIVSSSREELKITKRTTAPSLYEAGFILSKKLKNLFQLHVILQGLVSDYLKK